MSSTQHHNEAFEAARKKWEEAYSQGNARMSQTESGIPLNPIYTYEDFSQEQYLEDLGFPGQYPYTRGVYPSMYRGRLWTIRQYSGMGTAEETNQRYHFLLKRGQTGLSMAFDLPTQMGYDSDDPLAREEVGRVGVAIDTVDDMERVFTDIPLEEISTHFTINSTATILFAMYLVVAEKRGIPFSRISGTLQNDIIKEYIARNTYIFPPRPALRLIGDTISYAYQHVPRFNPISITGYHAREAGSDAVQEVAYALSAAVVYVQTMLERGIPVDDFAPRLSFHFSSQRDFFEEICKVRAARRLWARIMKERFHAKHPNSLLLRYFNGGSGASLSHAEPLTNIIRGTMQCLAGVLGGAQACHVPSYDEAYTIPSEEAALLSLRTQQIIAHESNVAEVIDPLGGSYFVESLTSSLEQGIQSLITQLEEAGGIVACIEQGELQRAITERAYETEKKIERGEHKIVGYNAFISKDKQTEPPPIPPHNPHVLTQQMQRLEAVKRTRNSSEVTAALQALREAARGDENVMPYIITAVRSYATVGEITRTLTAVFGTYHAPASM